LARNVVHRESACGKLRIIARRGARCRKKWICRRRWTRFWSAPGAGLQPCRLWAGCNGARPGCCRHSGRSQRDPESVSAACMARRSARAAPVSGFRR
jgi:hypothetical protein